MKKVKTEQTYSMSEFIRKIIYAAEEQNIEIGNYEDKTKYLSKVIRKTILPSLDLAEFISDYEGKKKNPYNHEWIDFYQSLINYDWLNGTTKEDNPARDDIRSQNHTIDNSLSPYKREIFSNLLFAIARGKTPEVYLKKLESTKLYKQGYTMWNFFIINKNIQNIISVADSYETYEKKANLINQITTLFNFMDGLKESNNIKHSVRSDLMIPQNIVQNPELLLITLKKTGFFLEDIAVSIIKSNLKFILDAYFSYICIKYKNSIPEEIEGEIKDLNKSVIRIIKNNSLPCKPYAPADIELSEVIRNQGIDYRKIIAK